MDINVKRISNVLIGLIKTFKKFKVTELEYSIFDDNLKINSYKVLNEKMFLEVGFGIFLEWFHHLKKKNFDGGQYNFINLDDDHTFFLYTTPNIASINNYNPNTYIKNMFDGTPSGNLRHRLCPLCHLFKYNLGCLDEELKDIDVPKPSEESCSKHKKEITEWFIKKIKEDEKYGKMFGGNGCLLHVTPKIFEILFTEETVMDISEPEIERTHYNSLDELLNSFLVLYVASLHEFNTIAANTPITAPIESHEIDAFLWNDREKFLVVLETTGEFNINPSHLKRKIYTAAVLNTLDISKYVYKYLTLGSEDDLKGKFGHVILYKRLEEKYAIPFNLITLPNRFNDVKDRKYPFNSKTFREIYQHYLNGLNDIFR
jgi:hypothetical protein